MVKFEVEIPDKVWKNIKENEGLVAMLVDSYDTVELNDDELFSELCGYIDMGDYGSFDIREKMVVKKLD